MTGNQSKYLGAKQVLVAVCIMFLLVQIAELLTRSRADLAKGFLFFLLTKMNVSFLLFVALYFSLSYFFGRRAGYFILINQRNPWLIALLYAFLTALITVTCMFVYLLQVKPIHIKSNDLLRLFPVNFFVLFGLLLITWLWSVKRIKNNAAS